MMTRFRALSRTDTLAKAVDELLAGSQQDFPVVDLDEPIGILRRNDLVKAIAQNRRDTAVEDVMCRDCESVEARSALRPVVEAMQSRQCSTVPVVQAGRLVGLLTLENISEMIMINNALQNGADRRGLATAPVAR
jgi:predicted transcriptional regulator